MNAFRLPAAPALALSVACLAGACPAPVARAAEAPRFTVRIEGGPAWQSLNDVQIPNDASGTRFSLCDLAGSGPWPAGRAYLTWRTGERHALRVLAAPFSIIETGIPGRTIDFAGATYAPGVPVEATYQFNSYRLSYRYRLHEGARWTWWTGFTAKVRDAKIELVQGATTSRKTDLGFVPLLHVAGEWRFAPGWQVGLDADALAGGPGRAEDVALTLGRDLGDAWTLTAGYRTVEGGADVDEVYTFAWLHYAVVGIERRF
jgi:hypothetical protein